MHAERQSSPGANCFGNEAIKRAAFTLGLDAQVNDSEREPALYLQQSDKHYCRRESTRAGQLPDHRSVRRHEEEPQNCANSPAISIVPKSNNVYRFRIPLPHTFRSILIASHRAE
jgi:hypothetical protein